MSQGDTHRIDEQDNAYRRGLVLGLTMAEVGLLIIFVLLLLITFGELQEEERQRSVEGQQLVSGDRLRVLERDAQLLGDVKAALGITDDSSADEIRRLVWAVQATSSREGGRDLLDQARAAAKELERVRSEIAKEAGSDVLAAEVERQSLRIANQEGQLKRYEEQLRRAGIGEGERPCWVTGDGLIEYLYDVVLNSNGLRMREYLYPHRARERSLLPMPEVDPQESLTPAEFQGRTRGLYEHSLAANCRFFVVIYDATGPTEKERYKALLRTVEGHFYKRLASGPAPF